VQVPALTIVALDPETVQTDVVELENETLNPELADALKVTVPPDEYVCIDGPAKVIVCAVGRSVAAVERLDPGTSVVLTPV
jgi:hypothetical protein